VSGEYFAYVRCPECGRSSLRGVPCQCDEVGWREWFRKIRAAARPLYFIAVDMYGNSHYWLDNMGNPFRAAGMAMYLAERQLDSRDALIAELTKLREENRDVLAENARLRRRLDGPR
jgi:hypothetical protein